jgi:regulatory protein
MAPEPALHPQPPKKKTKKHSSSPPQLALPRTTQPTLPRTTQPTLKKTTQPTLKKTTQPTLKKTTQPTLKKTTQPTLRGRALRLLSRREFSRQELGKRLRAYSETPAELESLLDELTERGWLSDARYAEALVRKRSGQFARRAIAQELKQAGVAVEVSDPALTQHVADDADAEFAAALVLCQRKFRHAAADQKQKARQIRFLQSRGYSIGVALRVLKQRGLAADADASDC